MYKYFNNLFSWKIFSSKTDIEEYCKKIGLSSNESKIIYNYYVDHLEEFMINSKTFYSTEYIVTRIIQKLNVLNP